MSECSFHFYYYLTHSNLGKIFSKRHIDFFFLFFFFQKTDFDISSEMSPVECQLMFSKEIERKISSIRRLLNYFREW